MFIFMCTDNRDEIIDLIKRLYADKTKKNLPIFAPSSTGLDKFCTTKEEASKGLTRMPRRETALEEENIIVEQLEEPEEDLKEDEDVDFKDYEKPQRMSSRIDPELIKLYNNPDAIKLEQEKLKKEKSGNIMQK